MKPDDKKLSARTLRIPDVEKLKDDPGYRQILELNFSDMVPFVLSNIKRRSIISFLYTIVNLGLLLSIITFIILELFGSQLTWLALIKQFIIGVFAGSILVIPLHEFLHGMAYRILGARKIGYGIDMHQLLFFVTADRYPVSGNELHFLALTPFVLINAATVSIIAIWLPEMVLFPAFFLLSHNIMCIGDFAMVNYVWLSRKKLYTYDESSERKSFFFEKIVG